MAIVELAAQKAPAPLLELRALVDQVDHEAAESNERFGKRVREIHVLLATVSAKKQDPLRAVVDGRVGNLLLLAEEIEIAQALPNHREIGFGDLEFDHAPGRADRLL